MNPLEVKFMYIIFKIMIWCLPKFGQIWFECQDTKFLNKLPHYVYELTISISSNGFKNFKNWKTWFRPSRIVVKTFHQGKTSHFQIFNFDVHLSMDNFNKTWFLANYFKLIWYFTSTFNKVLDTLGCFNSWILLFHLTIFLIILTPCDVLIVHWDIC
jgi:hypothetical protein